MRLAAMASFMDWAVVWEAEEAEDEVEDEEGRCGWDDLCFLWPEDELETTDEAGRERFLASSSCALARASRMACDMALERVGVLCRYDLDASASGDRCQVR